MSETDILIQIFRFKVDTQYLVLISCTEKVIRMQKNSEVKAVIFHSNSI